MQFTSQYTFECSMSFTNMNDWSNLLIWHYGILETLQMIRGKQWAGEKSWHSLYNDGLNDDMQGRLSSNVLRVENMHFLSHTSGWLIVKWWRSSPTSSVRALLPSVLPSRRGRIAQIGDEPIWTNRFRLKYFEWVQWIDSQVRTNQKFSFNQK